MSDNKQPQGGIAGPPNKGMKLTKLVAAPVRQAEVPPRARAAALDAGTASQLIPGVRRTLGRAMLSQHGVRCRQVPPGVVGTLFLLSILAAACTLWRMNEDARRALFVARHEAVERGAAAIDTEHLLLGIIRSDPGLLSRVAARAGYEEAALIRRLDQLSPVKAKPAVVPIEMPLSKGSSDVLRLARRQLSWELTPADLLVALIKVDGVASQALRGFGVTDVIVREAAAEVAAADRR